MPSSSDRRRAEQAARELSRLVGGPLRFARIGSGRRTPSSRRRGGLFGTVLKMLGRAVGAGGSVDKIARALELLEEAGLTVDTSTIPLPPPIAPPPSGPSPVPPSSPPGGFTTLPRPQQQPAAPPRGIGPSQIGAPPLPGEESPFGQEILTPESSNVYSFSYHREQGQRTGTLYVTFKAPKLSSDVKTGKGRLGGRDQLRGSLGSTITGKSNARGPMYAYYNVPPGVFTRMQQASSKGKFVWDKLRIRGTIYGHQYRYSLVQGAVITSGGASGTYIPRKATKKGFRVRSVADAGQGGRRGFQSSTLPAQTGFSTRRRR